MRRCFVSFLLIIMMFSSCTTFDRPVVVEDPNPELNPSPTLEPTASPTPYLTPDSTHEGHFGVVKTATEIDETLADLQGLPLNEFFDQSFLVWISRDPEAVTVLNLDEILGVRNDQLTDISEEYILETQRLERGILDLLRTYNRSLLNLEQMLNYDIYLWFFEDRVASQEFHLLNYLVHNYPYTSEQNQFIQLMTLYQPLEDRADIEDYLSRLAQIDGKTDQLISALKSRESIGAVPPRIVLVDVLNQTKEALALTRPGASRPEDTILYQSFKQKLHLIDSVSEVDKIEYLRTALSLLDEVFFPAYTNLADYLTVLLENANDDAGLWKVSQGQAYYQYLIRHYTGQDLTAEQVFTMGEILVDEDKQTLKKYLLSNNLIESEAELDQYSKHLFDQFNEYQNNSQLSTNPYFKQYTQFYDQSKTLIQINFRTTPSTSLIDKKINDQPVIGLLGIDQIRDPVFDLSPQLFTYDVDYEDISLRSEFFANHIPGTALQRSFITGQEAWPLFRKYLRFSGYQEGWSGYVLSLMVELWAFGDDPLEKVYKLERDLFLSTSVVIDSGIHHRGWSLGEGSLYLEEAVGLPRHEANTSVERFAVMPGQVLSYRFGTEKFMQLRYFAEQELGPKFSFADYHHWLLSLGDMPLEILEKQVELYVLQQQKANESKIIP